MQSAVDVQAAHVAHFTAAVYTPAPVLFPCRTAHPLGMPVDPDSSGTLAFDGEVRPPPSPGSKRLHTQPDGATLPLTRQPTTSPQNRATQSASVLCCVLYAIPTRANIADPLNTPSWDWRTAPDLPSCSGADQTIAPARPNLSVSVAVSPSFGGFRLRVKRLPSPASE